VIAITAKQEILPLPLNGQTGGSAATDLIKSRLPFAAVVPCQFAFAGAEAIQI